MEKINEHNYEAFLLDYFEGNLSAEQTAELMLFAEQNPQLEIEMEDFEAFTLEEGTLPSLSTDHLKKEVGHDNVEEFIIGSIENQNTESEEKELAAFIEEKEGYEELLERYKKTVLLPIAASFPNKAKLKRRGAIVYMIPTAVAAASVALFFFLGNPDQQINLGGGTVAKSDSIVQPIIKEEIPTTDNNQIAIESEDNYTEQQTNSSKNLVAIESAPQPRPKTRKIETIRMPKNGGQVLLKEVQDVPVYVAANYDFNRNYVSIADSELEEPAPSYANNSKTLTGKEWINKTFRKKVLKEENPEPKPFEKGELFAALVNDTDNSSDKKMSYTASNQADYDRVSFKLGNFEFYRSKKKN